MNQNNDSSGGNSGQNPQYKSSAQNPCVYFSANVLPMNTEKRMTRK